MDAKYAKERTNAWSPIKNVRSYCQNFKEMILRRKKWKRRNIIRDY
jgi:hypothetical protein